MAASVCLIGLKYGKPCWKWKKKLNMELEEKILLMALMLVITLQCHVKARIENIFYFLFCDKLMHIVTYKHTYYDRDRVIHGRYYDLMQPGTKTLFQ